MGLRDIPAKETLTGKWGLLRPRICQAMPLFFLTSAPHPFPESISGLRAGGPLWSGAAINPIHLL